MSKEGKLAANIELKCKEADGVQVDKQVAVNVKQTTEYTEHNEVVTRGWAMDM